MSDSDFRNNGSEFGVLQRSPRGSFDYEDWSTIQQRLNESHHHFSQPVVWEHWKRVGPAWIPIPC